MVPVSDWVHRCRIFRSALLPGQFPYVTAVAIVQALPYGQAMGTYMNNPYQLRVNLRLDADRVLRWTAHQRYSPAEAFGSGSLQQPQNDNPGILKPTAVALLRLPTSCLCRCSVSFPSLSRTAPT